MQQYRYTAAPAIFIRIHSPCFVGAEEIENGHFFSWSRLGPQAAASKSRNACKPANKVALQNAPWRARHHEAPSPPRDGDTTEGGGGGYSLMQLHRTTA